jgi:bifunctional DNA-binding transcriptional regulator/antitoxin component of YhaV-PrlF toxin-antitoxin module
VVELEQDPDSDDIIMPLPQQLLASLGWQPGDVLVWGQDEDTGEITLKKKTDE